MKPEEYTLLWRLDRSHWYYRAKRAIVRHWIGHFQPLCRDDLLIDAGCGMGTFLVEMAEQCRVLGIDSNVESLKRAGPRVVEAGGEFIPCAIDDVDLPDGCAAVVTLLDVLEHLADAKAVVREMTRLVRPGGLLVVTVPAMNILWSDWDVSLGHQRRYSRRQLIEDLDLPELDLVRCSFFNSLAFPIVFLARKWRGITGQARVGRRAEDVLPPRPINSLLQWAMEWPACQGWWRPPCGVSLLAVVRKKA